MMETCGVTGPGKEYRVLSIIPVCVKAQKGKQTLLDPGGISTFATELLKNQQSKWTQ